MCALFGVIRGLSTDPASINRATSIFIKLGIKAEERGVDSAGVAAITVSADRNSWTEPTATNVNSVMTTIDNTIILKNLGYFTDLGLSEHRALFHTPRVLIGHTRAASQGAADDLRNASPLLAGALVGTHNGDISIDSIPGADKMKPLSDTDSARLYLALDAVRGDRRAMVQVLKTVHGRAALVFADRTRPDRLYIARAGLSPLALAFTTEGDLFWASNPDWFRQIEEETLGALAFENITLIPEGTLLTINTLTATIEDMRSFIPTVRERDLYILNSVVYKRFQSPDRNTLVDSHRHKVATIKAPSWPGLISAPEFVPHTKTLLDKLINGSEEEIDLDEVEHLCWATGTFDEDTYLAIVDCTDEKESITLLNSLRNNVNELITAGKSVEGYQLPARGKTGG